MLSGAQQVAHLSLANITYTHNTNPLNPVEWAEQCCCGCFHMWNTNFHHFHCCLLQTQTVLCVVHHCYSHVEKEKESGRAQRPFASVPSHIKHLLDILFLWNPIELNTKSSPTLVPHRTSVLRVVATERYASMYCNSKVFYLPFQWDKLAEHIHFMSRLSVIQTLYITLENFIQCVMSC